MKIIALMPVKNEAWIIGRTLSVLARFCDHIIVADQRSTDGTSEILKEFSPKVTVVDNPSATHSTNIRWRLLEEARNFDGDNFIFCFDADEIPSANIVTPGVLEALVDILPGTALEIPWIQLWRDPLQWRDDGSVWSQKWILAGFRDDRAVQYGPILSLNDHNSRIPACRRLVRAGSIKLLHYQFVLFERSRAKQCWYRAAEAVALGGEKAAGINFYYRVVRDEREVGLSPVLPAWIAGWQQLGIDLETFSEEPLYWYDVEVLRWFKEKTPAYFAPIDLWDLNWEAKRRLALARGIEGMPAEPVIDPRNWEQKLYHAYLAHFQRHPFWRDPRELARLAHEGLKWCARELGVKRRHLEHLGLLKPSRPEI
jgi:glycosyltransferase involved in cell wall biosynthesis